MKHTQRYRERSSTFTRFSFNDPTACHYFICLKTALVHPSLILSVNPSSLRAGRWKAFLSLIYYAMSRFLQDTHRSCTYSIRHHGPVQLQTIECRHIHPSTLPLSAADHLSKPCVLFPRHQLRWTLICRAVLSSCENLRSGTQRRSENTGDTRTTHHRWEIRNGDM